MKAVPAARHGVPVACVNLATVDLGVPFDKLTAALQKCYDRHFLPVWGYPLKLYNTRKPKPTDWQLVYMDDADKAGDLGYHNLTKNGQPVSKVFVKTSLDQGELVSVTACHELFEMAIDPLANLWAQGPHDTEYAYEMCDPVEEDTFLVDGIPMSNFLHPSWFEPIKHPPGTKFDHLGSLKKPFSMTRDGYAIIKKNGKIWELFASGRKERRFAKEQRVGHRSEHRKPDGLLIAQKKRRPGRL